MNYSNSQNKLQHLLWRKTVQLISHKKLKNIYHSVIIKLDCIANLKRLTINRFNTFST